MPFTSRFIVSTIVTGTSTTSTYFFMVFAPGADARTSALVVGDWVRGWTWTSPRPCPKTGLGPGMMLITRAMITIVTAENPLWAGVPGRFELAQTIIVLTPSACNQQSGGDPKFSKNS